MYFKENQEKLFLILWSIPVATLSKAWVCGRSLAGIAGFSPAGDIEFCLLWVLFVVRSMFLRRADKSSSVLPSVVEEPHRGELEP